MFCRTTMLKEMLNDLERLAGIQIESQLKSLVYGIEPKIYLPLMKRQKCGTSFKT